MSPGGPEPFRSLAEATIPIAYAQLDGEALGYLRALPLSLSLELDGRRCLLVHATPHDPLYRAVGPDPTAWPAELDGVDAETVLVGHTHLQFDLALGRHRVINPGSVGLPLDGDPRPAYAVLEGGRITLRRVAYPIDRTIGRCGAPASLPRRSTSWRFGCGRAGRHSRAHRSPRAPRPGERLER